MWENVKLNEVKVDGPSPLPEGDFVFQLLPGASTRVRNDVEELVASAAIAEGEYAGRRVFLQYPDPESVDKNGKKRTWSAQALKKLELALGIDANAGEDPAAYLNRAAQMGAVFGATLEKGNYVPAGQTEPRVDLKLFSVRPASVAQAA